MVGVPLRPRETKEDKMMLRSNSPSAGFFPTPRSLCLLWLSLKYSYHLGIIS